MTRWVRLLTAGQLDAGFASLATFAVGIVAVRTLDPASLGAYAVFFAAFNLAAELSAQLVFVPSEVTAVELDGQERMTVLNSSMRRGLVVALAGCALVWSGSIAVGGAVSESTVTALAWSATIAAFLSPVQDHLRRMFHLAGISGRAAVMSGFQLGAALIAIAVLGSSLPAPWVPFGALAVANTVSLVVGLWMARSVLARYPGRGLSPPWRTLIGMGSWLLLLGLLSTGAAFLVNALVAQLAGPSQVGYAEGARVVARPLQVVAMGVLAIAGPRLMAAAARSDERAARRLRYGFVWAMVGLFAVFVLAVGWDWSWNPIAAWLPNAYSVAGLVALSLLANTVQNLTYPVRSELMGVRRQRALAMAELPAGAAQVATAGLAGVLSAYVIPLAGMVGAVVRGVAYIRANQRTYLEPRDRSSD